jgi:hypothetical protein
VFTNPLHGNNELELVHCNIRLVVNDVILYQLKVIQLAAYPTAFAVRIIWSPELYVVAPDIVTDCADCRPMRVILKIAINNNKIFCTYIILFY